MEKPLVESRVDKIALLFMLVGSSFFSVITFYLASGVVEQFPNWDLTLLIIAFFFGIPTLMAIYYVFGGYNKVRIFEDRFEITTMGIFFTKVIFFNDVVGYNIKETQSEQMTVEEIAITTKKRSIYTMNSFFCGNYHELKKVFLSKIKYRIYEKNTPADLNWGKKMLKTLLIVLVALGCYALYFFYQESNYYSLNHNNLTEIIITLAQKPEIERTKKRNYLLLKVKEYPLFKFDVSGIAYSILDVNNFVASTEANETIYLTINKNEYEQKLSKETPLTFWMKHNSYNQIGNIYGIRTNNLTYFTPNDYVEATKRGAKWGYVLVIVCALYIIYELQKNRK